jgi:hypothetical protein
MPEQPRHHRRGYTNDEHDDEPQQGVPLPNVHVASVRPQVKHERPEPKPGPFVSLS